MTDPSASPCTGHCTLDPTQQHCLGCHRSLAEIAAWPDASPTARRAILAAVAARQGPGRAAVHKTHPVTPDGRYFVVRGRLWRCSDPRLDPAERAVLVQALMTARRAKGQAMRQGDAAAREAARAQVETAKQALGERGPVWWDDGAPDYNRHLARNSPYAEWFAGLGDPGLPQMEKST